MNSIHENVGLKVVAHNVNVVAGGTTTDYVDFKGKHRICFIVEANGAQADAYTYIKLVEATTSGGAGVQDITNGGINATGLAGFAADEDKVVLEIDKRALDIPNGYGFVAVKMAAGAGADNVTVTAMWDPVFHNDEVNCADPDNDKVLVP